MTKVKNSIIAFIIFIISFWYFSAHVIKNTHEFKKEEMYWISSGRIVPLILSGNFSDPFWQEDGSYAQFNGVKLLYGLGLWASGYQNFSYFGYPPDTISRFSSFEGAVFPTQNPYFGILKTSRLISAFYMSLSMVVLALLAYVLFGQWFVALGAFFLLISHSLAHDASVLAFPDSAFLFVELLLLLGIELYLAGEQERFRLHHGLFLGVIFALLLSCNAFAIAFLVILFLAFIKKRRIFSENEPQYGFFFADMGVFLFFSVVFFLIINPQVAFGGGNGLVHVVSSQVTRMVKEVQDLKAEDPGNALLPFHSRALFVGRLLLDKSAFGLLFVLSLILLFLRRKKSTPLLLLTSRYIAWFSIVFVVMVVFFTVVKPFYLLYTMPFLIPIACYPLALLFSQKKR